MKRSFHGCQINREPDITGRIAKCAKCIQQQLPSFNVRLYWICPGETGARMLTGYARISTDDQHPGLQRDSLANAGCERVFEDTASGASTPRRLQIHAISISGRDR
ncbi:recombinase family protein [Paraburkholderia gardini]